MIGEVAFRLDIEQVVVEYTGIELHVGAAKEIHRLDVVNRTINQHCIDEVTTASCDKPVCC